MEAIKIIEPGLLTTVQDKGRKGYQRFGMPVGGAMDLFSSTIANLLVGNNENDALIEFTFLGPKIVFLEDIIIAITGADATPLLDKEPIGMWQSILAKKGSELSFKGIRNGLRGYIAFSGGIDVPPIMGSRSTYLRGKIGGYKGRKLISGDILYVKKPSNINFFGHRIPDSLIPNYDDEKEVRTVLGPQEELFKPESIELFYQSIYEVTSQSDRMGYRLKGPSIEHKGKADIISDGIPLGAIQVPGNGQPIIMLADKQTIGGYAKIATVISPDLNLIAQKKPRDKIKFKNISLEQAYEAVTSQKELLCQIKNLLSQSGLKRYFKIKIFNKEYFVEVEKSM